MSLCTAVLIDHEGGSDWVVADTVATYGREEERYAVRGALSAADVQTVGQAYLRPRKAPTVATTVVPTIGAVAGVDYNEGDTVTVDGVTQQCVGIGRKLDQANGRWLPRKPSFSSLVEESRRQADRAVDRIVASQGGGAVTATAEPSRVPLELGAIKKLDTLKWTFYDPEPSGSRTVLDDVTTWQDEVISEVCRGGGILATTDYDGATAWSIFEIMLNGVEWDPLFTVVLDDTPPPIPWAHIPQFGYQFLFPGDVLSVRCTQNGQHRQGAISIDLVPAT